jgi:hypothetical protein
MLQHKSSNVTNNDIQTIIDRNLLGTFPVGFKFACNQVSNPIMVVFEKVCQLMNMVPRHAVHVICSSISTAHKLCSLLSGDAITKQFGVKVVSSTTLPDEQEKIAKLWSDGCLEVLIGTTCTLVGNESNRCRSVLVLGHLYNLTNIVQAVGRLRMPQRHSSGCFEIYLPPLCTKLIEEHNQQDKANSDKLFAKGLLDHGAMKSYNETLTNKSLRDWITTCNACRIVSLSAKFGMHNISDCKVCDVCVNKPVVVLAEKAKKETVANNDNANEATIILKNLELYCMVCGKAECKGELCLSNTDCFKCGGCHYAVHCPADISRVLRGRGCFFCYDIYGRKGYKRHLSHECPTERRLRRLIIDCFQNEVDQVDFERYLTGIVCNNQRFYEFLVRYKKKLDHES